MSTENGTDTQSNYLSGNPSGWGMFDGGTRQQNLPSMPVPLQLQPDNPAQYDAILKLSDGIDGRTCPPSSLSGLSIAQGFEDALNLANQAHHFMIGGKIGIGAGGRRVVTMKGGTHDNSFEPATQLCSRGQSCDVKIGDWMDQTYDADHDNDLSNLSHQDGKPVRVGCNFRSSNITFGPNCRRLFWYSVGMTAYWWLKWTVRAVMRIPVGKAGPSFLP